jgi:TPR repeat protein
VFNKNKIKIAIIISVLSLSGCMSTENDKQQQMNMNQSIKKDQYMLSQAIDLNKKGEYIKAIEMLQPLSRTGMPESQSLLGKAYHLGLGTKKDPQKAEYWYKLAASQNYSIAIYLLANLYKEHKDLEGYNLYLKRAVLLDLNIATEMLALDLFLNKDKGGLIEWHDKTKMLSNNYIFENYLLDYLIEENKTEENSKELLIWIKSLADKGNSLAQYKYGLAYLKNNYGLKGNLKTSEYWLKKAALNDNLSAQRDLGMIYYKQGDYKNAYIWFLLYSEVNTLESLKLRTLSLSKLTQLEINQANQILNDMIQEKIDKESKK